MDADTFQAHFDPLVEFLEKFEPNPTYTWVGESRRIDELHASAGWLLDHLDELPEICETADTAAGMRAFVLKQCSGLAAVLEAAGRTRQATPLLERCARYGGGSGPLYAAGAEDPAAFTKVIRAIWLFNNERRDDAQALAAALRDAPEPIAELARQIERVPEPIDGAPSVFTLNGFGLKFYGDVDRESDGSYTAIRFITALFIPLFPIDSYRLTDHGDQFAVHGKVKLGPAMRAWQYIVYGLVVVGIGWAIVGSVLNSPERKIRKAVDEIAQFEASDPEAALSRYEELSYDYVAEVEDSSDLLPITQGWVRTAVALIPEPVTTASVDPILTLVERFSSLPTRLHEPTLAAPFVDQLLAWSDSIGTATPEAADASLDLLAAAERFCGSGSGCEAVDSRVRQARTSLASALAEDWPLEALRQYAQLLDEDEAVAAMTALVDKLPNSPTLFADVGPELQAWSQRVGSEGDAAVELANRGLAMAQDPARAELLASTDPEPLLAALEADPTDQGVIQALAELDRAAGRLDEAAERVASVGPPGLMTHDLQLTLASIEFDRGHAEQAAVLLDRMLRTRMPAFEDARRAYDQEFEAIRTRVVSQAESGNIPAQYRTALTGDDVEAGRAAFEAWLGSELGKSTKLPALQDKYMRQSDIVGVAILLGTVQLQRARATTGDEREQLLNAAEAAFLAIRSEAGGVPSYHVSLGQVYYRLGRTEQAEAEFSVLLQDPDPMVHLTAAQGYRDIGQREQATQIAERVYEAAPSLSAEGPPIRHRAAVLLSLLAEDSDDRKLWLERASSDDEFVKVSLIEVEGDALRKAGEFGAADDKYAEAFDLHYAMAEREKGSFNNAALALLQRHSCTGDVHHVDEAVELMERSVAMTPDNGLVVGNYAMMLDFRAQLDLLDGFIPTKGLRIIGSEVGTLLSEVYRSSLHDRLVAAVATEPARQRALDVWAKYEALSPQSVEGYGAQLTWATIGEDADAVTRMKSRLEAVEGLEIAGYAEAKADYIAGVDDAEMLTSYGVALERRAAVRDKAKRASAATKAALFHLDGETLGNRARIQADNDAALADLRASVEAFEAAQKWWPEGLSAAALADSLVHLAVRELLADNDELLGTWTRGLRDGGTTLTLWKLHEAGQLPAGFATHPAIARSLELRREVPDASLSALDLALGIIVSDDQLQTRAKTWLRAPMQQGMSDISILLAPYDSSIAESRAWLEAQLGG